MKKIIVVALFLLSPFALAQTPHLDIQEDRPFWTASAGMISQPLPNDSADLANFNFGYMYVDEGVLQVARLGLGLSSSHQIIAPGYAIAFGPKRGYWHIGMQVHLGYAHLYDKQSGYIHGLYYQIGPIFDFTIPWWSGTWWPGTSLRFHASAGWSALPFSNGNFEGTRNFEGWSFQLGASFSIE